jgi:flagellar biosynthetic protein FliO
MPTCLKSATVFLAVVVTLVGVTSAEDPMRRGDAVLYRPSGIHQADYSVPQNQWPSAVQPAMASEADSYSGRPEKIMPVQFTLDEGVETDSPNRPEREQGSPEPLKLSGPSGGRDGSAIGPTSPTATGSVVTVGSSLAIVLGLFFALLWLAKRNMPRGMTAISSEVIKVLGRAPLSGRQQMHLVRIGNKLLLVSVTAHGAETLTEITDPQEVDHLTALCERDQPRSVTRSFRDVLAGLGEQAAAPTSPDVPPANDPLVGSEQSTAAVSSVWEERHVT